MPTVQMGKLSCLDGVHSGKKQLQKAEGAPVAGCVGSQTKTQTLRLSVGLWSEQGCGAWETPAGVKGRRSQEKAQAQGRRPQGWVGQEAGALERKPR